MTSVNGDRCDHILRVYPRRGHGTLHHPYRKPFSTVSPSYSLRTLNPHLHPSRTLPPAPATFAHMLSVRPSQPHSHTAYTFTRRSHPEPLPPHRRFSLSPAHVCSRQMQEADAAEAEDVREMLAEVIADAISKTWP